MKRKSEVMDSIKTMEELFVNYQIRLFIQQRSYEVILKYLNKILLDTGSCHALRESGITEYLCAIKEAATQRLVFTNKDLLELDDDLRNLISLRNEIGKYGSAKSIVPAAIAALFNKIIASEKQVSITSIVKSNYDDALILKITNEFILCQENECKNVSLIIDIKQKLEEQHYTSCIPVFNKTAVLLVKKIEVILKNIDYEKALHDQSGSRSVFKMKLNKF